ncbi:MAG TPA: hypothetical protein VFZ65_05350 [Planctomycetota bacterium]|nr:hypothetical protein [Planctomycetota bacterium]
MQPLRSLLAALGAVGLLAAQAPTTVTTDEPTGFLDKTLTVGGEEHRYVVYVPPGYTKTKPWPLLVFLNGMGECGTDGRKHVEVGLGPAMAKDPQRWPFVVVFPQKPDPLSQWIDHEEMVMAMLAATEQDYAIDGRRRFLTGLSQGGAGTWALGAKHEDVWAAIAPVCGYGKPAEVAAALKHMPIWAFHGLDDKTVPARQSKDLVAAVEAAGGTPLLTLYENTAHNSWDRAYRESGLAEWLCMVADEPVAARYFADPRSLATVRIEIRRHSAPAGKEPATRTACIEAEDKRVSLSCSGGSEHSSEPSAVGQALPAESWHDAAAAQRFVYEPLRDLQRSGVFRRGAQPTAEPAALGDDLEVVLTGLSGAWRFRTHVPSTDAAVDRARAALGRVFDLAVSEVR